MNIQVDDTRFSSHLDLRAMADVSRPAVSSKESVWGSCGMSEKEDFSGLEDMYQTLVDVSEQPAAFLVRTRTSSCAQLPRLNQAAPNRTTRVHPGVVLRR